MDKNYSKNYCPTRLRPSYLQKEKMGLDFFVFRGGAVSFSGSNSDYLEGEWVKSHTLKTEIYQLIIFSEND